MCLLTCTCQIPKYLLIDILCNILSRKCPNFVGKNGDSLCKTGRKKQEENKKTLILKIFLLKLQDYAKSRNAFFIAIWFYQLLS